MKYEIRCSVCNKSPSSLLAFKCPSCSEPLDVKLDFNFEPDKIRTGNYSLWRYEQFFPYAQEREKITLSEGWTPLVRFSDNVYVKLESANPTGSFKDRGSTVLFSALHELIREAGGYISEDSSGNAGASMAAYAARAGLNARIYVPESVAGPKFNQIQFYGAQVTKVSGGRARVTEEAQKMEKRKFYVGHILHPLFRDGMRSLAYELLEQFGWSVPERIYLPVSAGTLLLGLISGFKHLSDSGGIDSLPNIVACQTQQVSPLYHLFKGLKYNPPETVTSIADALVSVKPPLLDMMVNRLKEVKGDAVMVGEDEIIEAFLELARSGFFVEPSSAVAFAGYKKQLRTNVISKENKVVIVLTGNGLKTTVKPV
ncbi:MAG: pyridoxal-phosphate dependent enzyme [Candidatus Bathyarchaeia archaeon]|jgi:threonine synthase